MVPGQSIDNLLAESGAAPAFCSMRRVEELAAEAWWEFVNTAPSVETFPFRQKSGGTANGSTLGTYDSCQWNVF